MVIITEGALIWKKNETRKNEDERGTFPRKWTSWNYKLTRKDKQNLGMLYANNTVK